MLSMESGNRNETAANKGEQAPESTSTAARSGAELSFWVPLGSAAAAPRDQGGCPQGAVQPPDLAASPQLREPERLLGEQEQKKGEQTCRQPRLLVIGLQL